jgi:hypothetical protein
VVVIRVIPFEGRPFLGTPRKAPYGAAELGTCAGSQEFRGTAPLDQQRAGSQVVALRQAQIFRQTELEKRLRGTRTIRRNTIAYRDCTA